MGALGDRLAGSPLLARLEAARAATVATGCQAWVVGGVLRDLMLGASSFPDVDIAVAGDVRALGEALVETLDASFVALDEERGTVRVVEPNGQFFDLTRLETSIEQDLARRDITFNAMALPLCDAVRSPSTVELLDPFDGLADLQARVVRTVSERSFVDDPLRLLRVFRFAAALDASVEPATLEAVRSHAALISRPAPERVARELFLLLDTPRASVHLHAMDDAGLLGTVLPELEAMRGVIQNEYHHLDVLGHSLEAVACLEDVLDELPRIVGEAAPRLQAFLDEELAAERTRRALVKFASLLHDIGKPRARATREGRVIFHTHNVLGAQMMLDVCSRLKLSRRETEEAVGYVDRHMLPGDIEAGGPLDDRREMRFFRRNGEQGLTLVLLSLADGMATRGPKADPERTERFEGFVRRLVTDYYGQLGTRLLSPPLVNGRDLMEELGLPPGPELGKLLKRVRHRQLVGEVTTREEAVALARRELERHAGERRG